MRTPRELREGIHPPRVVPGPRVVESRDGMVVELEEVGVRCGRFESRPLNHPEHPHGVVRGCAPERVVEPAEHRSGVTMPAPPEIDCELAEATHTVRKGRQC